MRHYTQLMVNKTYYKKRHMKNSSFQTCLFYIILIIPILIIFESASYGQSNNIWIMKYNKLDMISLDGQTVIGKKTEEKSGKLEFSPTEIKVYTGNTFERFYIKKVVKQSDGYQINTQNNREENFIFGIIKRQGIAFVTMNFIDIEMMGMFHISEDFSLNIPMYNK
jgi:hypothetical protein